MEIKLEHYSNINVIESFLKNNKVSDYNTFKKKDSLVLNIANEKYSKEQLKILKRHFSFHDIFYWSSKGLENVILWEKANRIPDVLAEFNYLFKNIDFDLITSIEARGFILGGIFAREFLKSFITIRKYKEIYDTLPGYKYNYVNWKGKEESLYIFKHSIKEGKVIVVDDIIETGSSLKAAEAMLARYNIEIKGAFYLMDTTESNIRRSFDFPIRSLLRYNDLFNNTQI